MLEETYPIRTDLALESQERLQKKQGLIKGVSFHEEERENGVLVSTVIIETENAAKAMGRPRGTYVTIEAPQMAEEEEENHRDISLELAKTIREFYDSKCVSIIFISGKTEYCLQLFELEPLNFHAKPLQKEKIFKDLRKVMRRSEENRNVIQYKEDGIIKGVLLRDVLYFEAVNKMVRLVLKSGEEIMVRIPLQDIYDRYRNYKIVRCHRSYVVNLSYVKKYYNNCFFMSNGDEIVVSKTYQKSIQPGFSET